MTSQSIKEKQFKASMKASRVIYRHG